MGPWETSVNSQLLRFPEADMIFLDSQRALEKASFGAWNFSVSISETYHARQLHHH